MDIKLSSGVIIGWQKGRIYQKVNATPAVVAHYDFGTLFWIDRTATAVTTGEGETAVTTITFAPATTADTTKVTATDDPKTSDAIYIGMVTAWDGLDTDANGYITLTADVRIDINAYYALQAELADADITTTMNLPAELSNNNMIRGKGSIELVNVYGGTI